MGEIKVSRSHVEEASRLAIQSSHVSCNLEFLFEAPRNFYNGGWGSDDDPVQIDCNPSNHRDYFYSDDHLDRHNSFRKFMAPLRGVQYELEDERRHLAREHERANRIYTDILSQFTGSPIKLSPAKCRDSNHNDFRSLGPSKLCVCCDCFLELVAHYFEFIDLNEVMQTDIEILRIKHRVLFEKTISLRWKPDNNQVHIGGFIGCRNSKSLEKIEITCTKWEDTIERSLSLSLSLVLTISYMTINWRLVLAQVRQSFHCWRLVF